MQNVFFHEGQASFFSPLNARVIFIVYLEFFYEFELNNATISRFARLMVSSQGGIALHFQFVQ